MREMKNSGVAWIGDIPENWKVLRNKNLIYEINERCTDTTDLPLLSVSEYYGVAPRADKIHDGQIVSRAETFEGYKICHQDDVVMNIMLAWKRAQAVSSFNGIVSPAYCVYRKKNNSKLDMTFFNYLIRSDLYISVFKRFSTGIIDSRLRLYPEKFLALHSHVPPTYEQHKIAKHLNKACNNIENLINNQEQQIEKLKQYKQSLITEVVTKGLNPDVPMKDSGVKWIGHIPENWTIKPLKSLFGFGKGLPITKENLQTNGVPVISYGQIHAKWNSGVTIHDELKRFVSETYIETNPNSLVKYGDFIFADTSEDREGCGNCVYVDKSETLFAGYHTVILTSSSQSSNKYLAYLFLTDAWRSQIRCKVSGIKVFSISRKILSSTSIILPDIAEQNDIVSYLDDKCAKIDCLIAIKQEKIDKLNDYKKSLIYEYVTGKREVC